MGKTHQYIAAPYELEAAQEKRLSAVIMPLQIASNSDLQGLDMCGPGTASKDGDGNWILTFPPHKDEQKLQAFVLKAYPKGHGNGIKVHFSEGDRIYLAEAWDTAIGPMGESFVFLTKQQHPQWTDQWQPPETMPPEAAQHWFTITDVRVCQGLSVSPTEYAKSGLLEMTGITHPLDLVEQCRIAASRWRAAYPGHSWRGDRWVVVLQVQPYAQP